MVLLIGTVIYASSENCVRQLRKGVTLDFPSCAHIYSVYCIVPGTIFHLILHRSPRSQVVRPLGLGRSPAEEAGAGYSARGPACLCGVLPARGGDFSASHLQRFLGGRQ